MPVESDIVSILINNKNKICQFEPIVKLCMSSMDGSKNHLTVDIQKKVIWEFLGSNNNTSLMAL